MIRLGAGLSPARKAKSFWEKVVSRPRSTSLTMLRTNSMRAVSGGAGQTRRTGSSLFGAVAQPPRARRRTPTATRPYRLRTVALVDMMASLLRQAPDEGDHVPDLVVFHGCAPRRHHDGLADGGAALPMGASGVPIRGSVAPWSK